MEAVRYHCSLHEDLLIEILLKLSVKSLLRFKSVCQHWLKILTNTYFVRNHFHRKSNSTSLLVFSERMLLCSPNNRVNEFSLFRVETLERYEYVYPRELIGSIRCIRGPCNGIFCVHYSDHTLALWNPATRRVRPVPGSPLPTTCLIKFRFGMDPVTDDIKIVLIAPKHVAIYSLTDDSWRVREEESLGNSYVYLSSGFYAPTLCNGFCYWLRNPSTTHPCAIIVFDMHNELFLKIEMPECIIRSMTTNLIWYGDILAVSTYNIIAGKGRYDIWIFKEQGCWVKIVTFSPLPTLHIRNVAGVWKRNQIVVVTSDRKLVIYDIDAGNTRSFEFRCIENSRNYPQFPFLYKESLVSL